MSVSLVIGRGFLGDAAGDTLTSIENLSGSRFDDALVGDAGRNGVFGQGGNDSVSTLDGDDWLSGGAGADFLDGGAGYDVAEYDDGNAGVAVNLATGRGFFGEAQGDVLTGIEGVIGTFVGDVLIGGAGANLLSGYNGNDTIDGGAGDDVLYGGLDSDFLRGGAGADELWGAFPAEPDNVSNNTASYTESPSGVSVDLASGLGRFGNAQGDRLEQIENLEGSAFADTLTGDAAANRLLGFGGNDILRGGAGADVLDGGAGFDWASYDDSATGVGVDLQLGIGWGGTAAGDRLSLVENLGGSNFGDALYGDALANELHGRDGADALNGHDGDDHLHGGEGLDTLRGGAGDDTLDGGAGSDRFEFKPGGGSDVVFGFTNGVDRLYFPGFGPAFDSAAELLPCATAVGGSTRITVPDPWATGQTTVTLARFDFADLDAADFVFA